MSRRSASMLSCRKKCATLYSPTTVDGRPRSYSPATTWTTWPNCALAFFSSIMGGCFSKGLFHRCRNGTETALSPMRCAARSLKWTPPRRRDEKILVYIFDLLAGGVIAARLFYHGTLPGAGRTDQFLLFLVGPPQTPHEFRRL